MSLLHILRSADVADAAQVINAQSAAGETVTVVVMEGATLPADLPASLPCYRVGNAPESAAEAIDYARMNQLIFAANTIVTW